MPTPARPVTGATPPRQTAKSPTEEATTTRPTHTRPAPTRPAPSKDAHRDARTGGRLAVACRRAGIALFVAAVLLLAAASPAAAASSGTQSLSGLISNLTTWLVGLLAGVATLFLTVGGIRYLTAGGDPSGVEKAKTALKSAAIGYALAALAPLIVNILGSLFGGH